MTGEEFFEAQQKLFEFGQGAGMIKLVADVVHRLQLELNRTPEEDIAAAILRKQNKGLGKFDKGRGIDW